LINQLLDLSKIEAGRATLNETAFDLYYLLDDLQTMFRLKADSKGLQLLFNRTPDVPQYVRTDEVKLRQVLINLLSNAIKFTKAGRVSVRVSAVVGVGLTRWAVEQQTTSLNPPLQGSVVQENGQHTITFEVEDTGSGIAKEDLHKLFQPFVQTKTGQQLQEGTGLGLTIARSFVQLMGGEITVSSLVGKGSVFKFDIQLSVVGAAEIKSQQSTCRVLALEPSQPSYRILIADDALENRQLLIKLLSPLGFELWEASNGIEAIEIWEKYRPQLIFMDVRMPMMDGYEATKQIRLRERNRKDEQAKIQTGQATAIVAVTAHGLEKERTTVFSVGCNDFIHKPFREADIFDALHKHIGVRFVYAESTAASIETNVEILTPEAITTLPPDLVANLRQAIYNLDVELMQTLIAQISELNQPLATAIASLAKDFKYRQLLDLTQPTT
jgi:CheY-like chemotaxis protein